LRDANDKGGSDVSIVLRVIRAIDEISRIFGLIAIWMVLFSALLTAFYAAFRYSSSAMLWFDRTNNVAIFGWAVSAFGRNSNSLVEAVQYMFAAMVMFGGAWALKINEHVRVDLIYGAISEKARTWIDLLGGLFFLMPLCILMIYFTWGWALQAFVRNEGSLNAGGLPLWPMRFMIPIGFAILGLQGIAEIVKCILALTTNYVREFAYEKPLQ
jgi:TRAP-type mannitol/chloroaromatic compound transport system permease small subunit